MYLSISQVTAAGHVFQLRFLFNVTVSCDRTEQSTRTRDVCFVTLRAFYLSQQWCLPTGFH